MEITTLKKVKMGEFFKRLRKGSPSAKVYVKDYYEPSEHKYWVYDYFDVNSGFFLKGSTEVTTDFEF